MAETDLCGKRQARTFPSKKDVKSDFSISPERTASYMPVSADSDFSVEFERRVENGLNSCGVNLSGGIQSCGVAVSGGADSVSLLMSMAALSLRYSFRLYVITVNHFIRPDDETVSDAEFVNSLCSKLSAAGFDVSCSVRELGHGEVSEESARRGHGEEEAARFLRYREFSRFVEVNGLPFLATAHNSGDQLETILMRFLQGASLDGASGIRRRRGIFVRPLIDVPRSDIERYLNVKGISWRTDSTNSDTSYLRNRIRHELVPFLDSSFPGWRTSVVNGAEKLRADSDFLNALVPELPPVQSDGSVVLDADSFSALDFPVARRLLLKACNRVSSDQRIPDAFVSDVIRSAGNKTHGFDKYAGKVRISLKNRNLYVRKYSEQLTDLCFSAIIRESGVYRFPGCEIYVDGVPGGTAVEITCGEKTAVVRTDFPFRIRNFRTDDRILAADGKMRRIADIFADWHIPPEIRPMIPLIQELSSPEQNIISILGSAAGFSDWTVKSV